VDPRKGGEIMKELNSYTILNVAQFGDPIEGTAQNVTLSHQCVGGKQAQTEVWFPKLLGMEKSVTCQDCKGSVKIVKQSGNIYLSGL
jgi:hypothetical protein